MSGFAGSLAALTGHDIFYSEPDPKILEVRDNGTSLQIGAIACHKGTDDERFRCQKTVPLRIGLFEIPRARVVKAWSQDIPCTEAQVPCRFLKVRLLADEDDAPNQPGGGDADLVGHDYEVLMTLPDHRPLHVRQVNRTAIAVGGMALFVFDFNEPVEDFELPAEARQAQ